MVESCIGGVRSGSLKACTVQLNCSNERIMQIVLGPGQCSRIFNTQETMFVLRAWIDVATSNRTGPHFPSTTGCYNRRAKKGIKEDFLSCDAMQIHRQTSHPGSASTQAFLKEVAHPRPYMACSVRRIEEEKVIRKDERSTECKDTRHRRGRLPPKKPRSSLH